MRAQKSRLIRGLVFRHRALVATRRVSPLHSISDLTTAFVAAAEGCRAAAGPPGPTIMAAGAQACDDVPFWAL